MAVAAAAAALNWCVRAQRPLHLLAIGDVLEQHDRERVVGEVLKAQHLLGRRHPAAACRFVLFDVTFASSMWSGSALGSFGATVGFAGGAAGALRVCPSLAEPQCYG